MQNSSPTKKATATTSHSHLHLIFPATLLLLLGIVAFLAFTLNVPAKKYVSSGTDSSRKTAIIPPAKVTLKGTTLGATPDSTGKLTAIQPTATQGNQHGPIASATATPPPATPTLLPSTPEPTQLGVFSLAQGGPLPVPETVLRPTNIARLMLNATLISVYAGSMAQNPRAGILCVLRENLTTGQLTLQVYQDSHMDGPLTILAIQNTKLKLTDTKNEGYFDLTTSQFQW
ncbi:MAG TPA: hypothetical protein VKV40_25230 [Ktedonobacteraceae bacterium]|nr:hypothetical protein [Ktedonobacteraceae bacterium]